jgi:hypothetical protein
MPTIVRVSDVIDDQKVFKVMVSKIGEAGNRFIDPFTFRERADADLFRAAQVRNIKP